jgi:predicted RNA binding protein YcfA (HicA-like mRNA interferase family)
MPKKIRELKAMLLKAGFTYRQGKGSHTNWTHPYLANVITIARKDGDDAPLYLEKQIAKALAELGENSDD